MFIQSYLVFIQKWKGSWGHLVPPQGLILQVGNLTACVAGLGESCGCSEVEMRLDVRSPEAGSGFIRGQNLNLAEQLKFRGPRRGRIPQSEYKLCLNFWLVAELCTHVLLTSGRWVQGHQALLQLVHTVTNLLVHLVDGTDSSQVCSVFSSCQVPSASLTPGPSPS